MCQTATFARPDVCVCVCKFAEVHLSIRLQCIDQRRKLALLEKGVCPRAPLHGCTDMVMNYAVDWSLLQPAVRLAMAQMHHQQYGIHILDADW